MDENEECEDCVESTGIAGYALGLVGLLVGSVFLYMAIDVLTNGAVTSVLGLGKVRDREADTE